MLSWDDCIKLSRLPDDEHVRIINDPPDDEFLDFMLENYSIEGNLGRNPCIRDIIADDISTARTRDFLELAAVLRLAIARRISLHSQRHGAGSFAHA